MGGNRSTSLARELQARPQCKHPPDMDFIGNFQNAHGPSYVQVCE